MCCITQTPATDAQHIMNEWSDKTDSKFEEEILGVGVKLSHSSSSPTVSKLNGTSSEEKRCRQNGSINVSVSVPSDFPTSFSSFLSKVQRSIQIPATHPYKTTWDICTIFLTFLCAYQTHISIKNRSYEMSGLVWISQLWFMVDIVLNFFTVHKEGNSNTTSRASPSSSSWLGGYLTTWFLIDLLSLLPWERVYIQPIIEMQNKRNILHKILFRTKVTVQVSGKLRTKHIKLVKMIRRIVKRTKKVGLGGNLLVRLSIQYLPKYMLYIRNMRGVILVKVLRQIHITRKVVRGLIG